MKILGNGVDIIENKRIEKAIKNKVFIDKIFSNKEKKIALKKSKNKVNFFAKRFVAKEAFLKAIGTGLSGGLSFKDIIRHLTDIKEGKPLILKTHRPNTQNRSNFDQTGSYGRQISFLCFVILKKKTLI